jgi:hypothetical protein
MGWTRVASIVVGLGAVAVGLMMMFDRDIREWGEQAPFHRWLYSRAPWLYPGPLRHMPFDERLWRRVNILVGVGFVVVGLVAILGVGMDTTT